MGRFECSNPSNKVECVFPMVVVSDTDKNEGDIDQTVT